MPSELPVPAQEEFFLRFCMALSPLIRVFVFFLSLFIFMSIKQRIMCKQETINLTLLQLHILKNIKQTPQSGTRM